jgi:hypothetical protein
MGMTDFRVGTFRTRRDTKLESAMRAEAGVCQRKDYEFTP